MGLRSWPVSEWKAPQYALNDTQMEEIEIEKWFPGSYPEQIRSHMLACRVGVEHLRYFETRPQVSAYRR